MIITLFVLYYKTLSKRLRRERHSEKIVKKMSKFYIKIKFILNFFATLSSAFVN